MTQDKKEYKYIFGPVPSRRLGMSLGVDLMPHKTCTLDCVYCESGKTTNLTVERKAFVPTDEVIGELTDFLSSDPALDYITFSGSGEPTLHEGIGDIVDFIKKNYPQYNVAILTNGTLFYLPEVRKQLLKADLIKASMDAVSDETFVRINRPHRTLNLEDICNGLVKLRQEFKNSLVIEVFFIPKINMADDELKKIKLMLDRIQPDQVQLNALDRPGTESWVDTAEEVEMKRIASYLGKAEIIKHYKTSAMENSAGMDVEHAIVSTIKRRPCTARDIAQSLGISEENVKAHADILINNSRIVEHKMPRGVFYKLYE
ncbi:MAG: radical SAM protein [Desulfobacterales bacterium]|nr:radical SAM protein [Desulfobacterales bacterium]